MPLLHGGPASICVCHFSIHFYSNKQLFVWLQFNHILNRKHVAKVPLGLTFEFKWLCHFHKSFYHTVLSYMLNSYLWRWCFLLFSSAYQKLSPCLTESVDSLLIYPIHGAHWLLTLFIFAVILATLSLKAFSDFHRFELSSGAGIKWQGINVFNQWQRLLSLNLSAVWEWQTIQEFSAFFTSDRTTLSQILHIPPAAAHKLVLLLPTVESVC